MVMAHRYWYRMINAGKDGKGHRCWYGATGKDTYDDKGQLMAVDLSMNRILYSKLLSHGHGVMAWSHGHGVMAMES